MTWFLALGFGRHRSRFVSEPLGARRSISEGSLVSRPRGARQGTSDTDVFVEIRPVDALAATDQTPVRTLRGRPVSKARVPRQGYADGPAVDEIDDQSIFRDCQHAGQAPTAGHSVKYSSHARRS